VTATLKTILVQTFYNSMLHLYFIFTFQEARVNPFQKTVDPDIGVGRDDAIEIHSPREIKSIGFVENALYIQLLMFEK